ncbi:hypothetical protein ACFOJ6_25330 [Gordonia humi]
MAKVEGVAVLPRVAFDLREADRGHASLERFDLGRVGVGPEVVR